MIWDTKPSDVLMIQGMVMNGIKIIFAKEILNLTQSKRK
jgi:hypothetical protein